MPTRRARPASELLSASLLGTARLPAGVTKVELRRSPRRRKTVSARVEADRLVLLLPAHLTDAQEREWVDAMAARLAAKRSRPGRSDEDLATRAESVARRYLDAVAGRPLRPSSIRWVSNMAQRWGSCSTDTGAIRLSDRLQQCPDWVVDYVLAHELAHLAEPTHGAHFRALVANYPQAERAQGYLEGWSAASGLPGAGGIDGPDRTAD